MYITNGENKMPKIGQKVTFRVGANEYVGTVTAHIDGSRVLVGLLIVSLKQIVRIN
jgi:hypothetical protein